MRKVKENKRYQKNEKESEILIRVKHFLFFHSFGHFIENLFSRENRKVKTLHL